MKCTHEQFTVQVRSDRMFIRIFPSRFSPFQVFEIRLRSRDARVAPPPQNRSHVASRSILSPVSFSFSLKLGFCSNFRQTARFITFSFCLCQFESAGRWIWLRPVSPQNPPSASDRVARRPSHSIAHGDKLFKKECRL